MSVKLLNKHNFGFLSLKKAAQARLSLHLSKCHIVGNHMSQLNYYIIFLFNALFKSNAFDIHDMYTGQSWSAVAQW